MIPASDRAKCLTKRPKMLCFIFYSFLLEISELSILKQLHPYRRTESTVLSSHILPTLHPAALLTVFLHWYLLFLINKLLCTY